MTSFYLTKFDLSKTSQQRTKSTNKAISISSMLAMSFAVFILSASPSFATAATPSQQSVEKLMRILQMDNMADDIQAQSADLIYQVITAEVIKNNQPLSQAQDKQLHTLVQLDALVDKYVTQLNRKTNLQQIRQQMSQSYVQAAQTHFTQAEVDAQIEFYGSTTGQAILKKQPEVMQSYMQHLLPTLMQQTQKNLNEILPSLKQEVQQILAGS